MVNNYNKIIGSVVKAIRLNHNLGSQDLINKLDLDINESDLYKIEEGLKDLSIDDFDKIVKTFNIDQDKLFEYACINCHNDDISESGDSISLQDIKNINNRK